MEVEPEDGGGQEEEKGTGEGDEEDQNGSGDDEGEALDNNQTEEVKEKMEKHGMVVWPLREGMVVSVDKLGWESYTYKVTGVRQGRTKMGKRRVDLVYIDETSHEITCDVPEAFLRPVRIDTSGKLY